MRAFRKPKRWVIVTLTISIALVAALFIADGKLRPIVEAMGEARVRALAVVAMNEAVKETILNNPDYLDLIEIVHDSAGKVTSLRANTIAMNDLAAKTALSAQERLSALAAQGLDIPIGSLVGGHFFVGKGPPVHIRIIPAGSVSTRFRSEFEYAGINQTRHRIFLELTSSVRVVVPPGEKGVEVATEVPVSETIIVGDVPETYIDVNDKQQMLDLLPSR